MDFPVVWADPADEERTWELDDMHAPAALAPLAADYMGALAAGIEPALQWFGLASFRNFYRAINGRVYFGEDFGVPDAEVPAELERLKAVRRAFAPKAARYWEVDCLPALHRIYADIAAIDVEGLDRASLAVAWRRAWVSIADIFERHMIVTGASYRALEDLADVYEAAFPSAAAGTALRLLQGENDILHAVDAEIARITDAVIERPAIADWLIATSSPSLDALEAQPGGSEVAGLVCGFLARHGHLGQAFDDLMLPSWSEAPGVFLGELANRVAATRAAARSATEMSKATRARLRDEAAALTTAARDGLAARPAELERFEAALAVAREIGHLTETHNYWMDRMAQAHIRKLSTRVGARLVHEGVIPRPGDVFFLEAEEIAKLLLQPADRRALVSTRRDVHTRNLGLQAPSILGKPPVDYGWSSRFDQEREHPDEVDQVKGIGASSGIVRGPARIVLREDDFGLVRPGDIVVSPSASPSWVSIFPIAGGLVTNTGGALSHAAVVAREFGLPAVVGAAGATTLIPPGRTVEIDGGAGTVRLV